MFYNMHTKAHDVVSLSDRRLRDELIEIENKELSKSRVVVMLSQIRKGHHIVKKKKKAERLATLWKYSEEKKQRLKGSIVFQEKYLEHEIAKGIERALTRTSLSSC